MLGNQYFLARRFHAAIGYLEATARKNPLDLNNRRRLIICCVAVGRIFSAVADLCFLLQRAPVAGIAATAETDLEACAGIEHELLIGGGTWLSDDEAELALAIVQLIRGDCQAVRHFEQVLAHDPARSDLVKLMSLLKVGQEHPS